MGEAEEGEAREITERESTLVSSLNSEVQDCTCAACFLGLADRRVQFTEGEPTERLATVPVRERPDYFPQPKGYPDVLYIKEDGDRVDGWLPGKRPAGFVAPKRWDWRTKGQERVVRGLFFVV